jgi:tetratricopeptide (TPR) repeat protein
MSKKRKVSPARPPASAAPAAPAVAIPIMRTSETAPAAWWDRAYLPPILVAAAALLAYGASLQNGFVFFDDDKAIIYNSALKDPSISKFFSGQNLGMYAPLTWIGYWLSSLISGEKPFGYHLFSLALHVLNAVLAFAFLSRLTRNAWAALFAALLFAVHPMQAEAVAWAAAFSTLLFSTFYLASLLAYTRWLDSPTRSGYAWSVLAFVLACLSKSAAVTLPLVLVLIDWYRDEKLLRKNWLSKIPFFLISLGFGLYTFASRAQAGHDIEAASQAYTLADRFWMISQTLLFYPVKLLFPFGFTVSYPFVKTGGAWPWPYYAAPAVLLGLALLAWWRGRGRPALWLGLGLYLLPLSIMLPFQTVGSLELRSDRYVYLSCLGLFFLAALALEKFKPALRTAVLAVLGLGLAALSFRQTAVWRDGVSLFTNCVEKTPESCLCQINLAYSKLIGYDFPGAIKHYSAALEVDPTVVEAYNGRGQAYFNLKQIPQALSDFSRAIEAGISTPKLFLNRGKCLVMLNRPAEAIPDLSQSLALEPASPDTWFFRAVAHEKTGNIPLALDDYSEAIRLAPHYVEALVNRGLLLYNSQRYEEAVADYSQALQNNPKLVMAWNNRANARLQSGQAREALADANQALTLDPGYGRAYQTRARIYLQLGEPALSAADAQKAQELQR